ncbi:hypothetical protein CEUSTIGMA_g61.t1 [Chlamydomonas eustigma]|uniref:Uncharacterized protein n=1 Tax=Chlamydomonas eustigma TaxID=1157962 RepID=A0A250WP46_9CHLO|nr:hypothetical protein CEUSTIGMA_g61.t1 [Chlamydomonas eustigma]|eukprot:GAX72605.1 hypothetical protein CEUSTIGMA_g61.t1 [Chlamydomonas eustigma]
MARYSSRLPYMLRADDPSILPGKHNRIIHEGIQAIQSMRQRHWELGSSALREAAAAARGRKAGDSLREESLSLIRRAWTMAGRASSAALTGLRQSFVTSTAAGSAHDSVSNASKPIIPSVENGEASASSIDSASSVTKKTPNNNDLLSGILAAAVPPAAYNPVTSKCELTSSSASSIRPTTKEAQQLPHRQMTWPNPTNPEVEIIRSSSVGDDEEANVSTSYHASKHLNVPVPALKNSSKAIPAEKKDAGFNADDRSMPAWAGSQISSTAKRYLATVMSSESTGGTTSTAASARSSHQGSSNFSIRFLTMKTKVSPVLGSPDTTLCSLATSSSGSSIPVSKRGGDAGSAGGSSITPISQSSDAGRGCTSSSSSAPIVSERSDTSRALGGSSNPVSKKHDTSAGGSRGPRCDYDATSSDGPSVVPKLKPCARGLVRKSSSFPRSINSSNSTASSIVQNDGISPSDSNLIPTSALREPAAMQQALHAWRVHEQAMEVMAAARSCRKSRVLTEPVNTPVVAHPTYQPGSGMGNNRGLLLRLQDLARDQGSYEERVRGQGRRKVEIIRSSSVGDDEEANVSTSYHASKHLNVPVPALKNSSKAIPAEKKDAGFNADDRSMPAWAGSQISSTAKRYLATVMSSESTGGTTSTAASARSSHQGSSNFSIRFLTMKTKVSPVLGSPDTTLCSLATSSSGSSIPVSKRGGDAGSAGGSSIITPISQSSDAGRGCTSSSSSAPIVSERSDTSRALGGSSNPVSKKHDTSAGGSRGPRCDNDATSSDGPSVVPKLKPCARGLVRKSSSFPRSINSSNSTASSIVQNDGSSPSDSNLIPTSALREPASMQQALHAWRVHEQAMEVMAAARSCRKSRVLTEPVNTPTAGSGMGNNRGLLLRLQDLARDQGSYEERVRSQGRRSEALRVHPASSRSMQDNYDFRSKSSWV